MRRRLIRGWEGVEGRGGWGGKRRSRGMGSRGWRSKGRIRKRTRRRSV